MDGLTRSDQRLRGASWSAPTRRTAAVLVAAAYRWVWRCTTGLLAALGLAEALLTAPPAGAIEVGIVAALLVGLGYRFRRSEHCSPSWRRAAAAASLGGLAGVASIGLAALFEQGAVGLLLAVIVTAPSFLGYAGRQIRLAGDWLRRGAVPPTSRPSPDPHAPVYVTLPPRPTAAVHDPSGASAAAMSDLELCQAWRSSTAALETVMASRDHAELGRLLIVRQRYLDELERRDPPGFRRWLHEHDRPESDPSLYINVG